MVCLQIWGHECGKCRMLSNCAGHHLDGPRKHAQDGRGRVGHGGEAESDGFTH